MNSKIDDLTMLLSTDWFLGKWHLWECKSSIELQKDMQARCRAIVSQVLLAEGDYWQVSFAPERQQHTCDAFFEAVRASNLDSCDRDFLRRVVSGSLIEPYQLGDISSLELLTQVLITNPDSIQKKSILAELQSKISRCFFNRDYNDIVAYSENPQTDWDKQIRDSTMDIPARLAHFVITVMEQLHFTAFWSQLSAATSRDEQHLIHDWYSTASTELLGYHIEIPAFETD